MQKKDPLGIQIWRLYSKAKNQLPNQERMDNLSWRMMSMNLKREQERARSDSSGDKYKINRLITSRLLLRNEDSMNIAPPSGIAQLRKSAERKAASRREIDTESMSIDELIQPSSVASPAGISRSPSIERMPVMRGQASAIPIKKQKEIRRQDLGPARASAPTVPPMMSDSNEFGYVQRHVRKTSIDERRVSFARLDLPERRIVNIHSLENARLNTHHKCLRFPITAYRTNWKRKWPSMVIPWTSPMAPPFSTPAISRHNFP